MCFAFSPLPIVQGGQLSPWLEEASEAQRHEAALPAVTLRGVRKSSGALKPGLLKRKDHVLSTWLIEVPEQVPGTRAKILVCSSGRAKIPDWVAYIKETYFLTVLELEV